MAWVAMRNVRISDTEVRSAGELVPEADSWHESGRRAAISVGHIREVPDPPVPPVAQAEVRPRDVPRHMQQRTYPRR